MLATRGKPRCWHSQACKRICVDLMPIAPTLSGSSRQTILAEGEPGMPAPYICAAAAARDRIMCERKS
jgi:hypothetical protein